MIATVHLHSSPKNKAGNRLEQGKQLHIKTTESTKTMQYGGSANNI
jgi:hypothetical protein